MNTEQFLKSIHNETISFRCLKAGTKNIDANGYYNKNIINILEQANNQNYEVYFMVNSGAGYRNEDVDKINSVFIDLDCGRDENKSYYSNDIVSLYKQRKLTDLYNFILKPSYIIETRNGFHVYWLLKEGATIEQFQKCEEQLINYFDADKQVKKLAQLMRVPNYYWCKDTNDKFKIEIIESNNVRYNIQDIMNVLPEVKGININSVKTNKKNNKQTNNTNFNIQAIKELNSEYMKTVVKDIEGVFGVLINECNTIFLYQYTKTPKYIARTRMEVYEIINKIDLGDFLGIDHPQHFKCIIHNDNNPSAGIFKGSDGSDIYKCHSSNCGFVGGIVKVVEKLAGCSKIEAINFIREIYGIELLQTEWQKEQIELLETNKEYLLSGKMEIEYPELWKYVKPRVGKLICFLDLAIKNCYGEELSHDNKPVFWTSISHLQNVFETSSRVTVNRTINLFALLKLIDKLPEKNIPEKMLKKAKYIMAERKYKKLPNHYQIPSYDAHTLELSEKNAITLKDNNFTMRGISREWILRTFGIEVANEIYPQFKYENKIGTSIESDDRTERMGIAINGLVNEKGYVLEKEIIEIFRGKYGKTKTETQIKRSLQEILNKYDLKRVRCNKKIKEQYGIKRKGYPFVIIKQ